MCVGGGWLGAGGWGEGAGAGARVLVLTQETYVTTAGPTIRFGKKSHAECAGWSPDGQWFVSGSIDGFVEARAPHATRIPPAPLAPPTDRSARLS